MTINCGKDYSSIVLTNRLLIMRGHAYICMFSFFSFAFKELGDFTPSLLYVYAFGSLFSAVLRPFAVFCLRESRLSFAFKGLDRTCTLATFLSDLRLFIRWSHVALSRVTDVSRLCVLLPAQGDGQTKNVVFPEVILQDERGEARDEAWKKEAWHGVEKHTYGAMKHGRLSTIWTWHGQGAESLSR